MLFEFTVLEIFGILSILFEVGSIMITLFSCFRDRNSLGALPARRIRASSGFTGISSGGSGRAHWRSLAGLEVADMTAKNIKVNIYFNTILY